MCIGTSWTRGKTVSGMMRLQGESLAAAQDWLHSIFSATTHRMCAWQPLGQSSKTSACSFGRLCFSRSGPSYHSQPPAQPISRKMYHALPYLWCIVHSLGLPRADCPSARLSLILHPSSPISVPPIKLHTTIPTRHSPLGYHPRPLLAAVASCLSVGQSLISRLSGQGPAPLHHSGVLLRT